MHVTISHKSINHEYILYYLCKKSQKVLQHYSHEDKLVISELVYVYRKEDMSCSIKIVCTNKYDDA